MAAATPSWALVSVSRRHRFLTAALCVSHRDREGHGVQHFKVVFAVADGRGVVEIGAQLAAQHAGKQHPSSAAGVMTSRLSVALLITRIPESVPAVHGRALAMTGSWLRMNILSTEMWFVAIYSATDGTTFFRA